MVVVLCVAGGRKKLQSFCLPFQLRGFPESFSGPMWFIQQRLTLSFRYRQYFSCELFVKSTADRFSWFPLFRLQVSAGERILFPCLSSIFKATVTVNLHSISDVVLFAWLFFSNSLSSDLSGLPVLQSLGGRLVVATVRFRSSWMRTPWSQWVLAILLMCISCCLSYS